MRQADHICYRCTSVAEYRSVCALLAEPHVGQLLIESMIGGRPIATFLLTKPMLFRNLTIRCIEVPCPKPGRPYKSGWEHVEFALCPRQASGEHSVRDKQPLLDFVSRHPDVPWDSRALQKDCNADVCLQVVRACAGRRAGTCADQWLAALTLEHAFFPLPPRRPLPLSPGDGRQQLQIPRAATR